MKVPVYVMETQMADNILNEADILSKDVTEPLPSGDYVAALKDVNKGSLRWIIPYHGKEHTVFSSPVPSIDADLIRLSGILGKKYVARVLVEESLGFAGNRILRVWKEYNE